MEDFYKKILDEAGYECPQQAGDPNAELKPKNRSGKWSLNQHLDPRGGLVELWRQSWEDVDEVAVRGHIGMVRQVYISETLPGVIKGWHLHPHSQIDRFVVIRGRVMVSTYDLMKDGDVVERVLDWRVPERIDVPPMVAHGWMALGNEPSWVLNLVSVEYQGNLEWRRPAHSGPKKGVPYEWRRVRDG